MQNKERRGIAKEIRAVGDEGKCIISGYAAVFESNSENLGGFIEEIAPGAFDNANFEECRALFNHDNNYVMASVKGGTLKLEVDERGLRYEFEVPESGFFYDTVYNPIMRGDIDQSSFAFTLDYEQKGDHWENQDGTVKRTILAIDQVFDISPVTYPAYQDTSVSARALDKVKSFEKPEGRNYEVEIEKEKLELLKL